METFLRPGFYDVEIRNNSGEFSTLIDPISSPFFEQVQVLEGAPKLELVGCLDFTGAESSCSSTATEFNIDSLKNFEFTGQNIFTLNRVDFSEKENHQQNILLIYLYLVKVWQVLV